MGLLAKGCILNLLGYESFVMTAFLYPYFLDTGVVSYKNMVIQIFIVSNFISIMPRRIGGVVGLVTPFPPSPTPPKGKSIKIPCDVGARALIVSPWGCTLHLWAGVLSGVWVSPTPLLVGPVFPHELP